ncbi:MAG TPA: TonB-dependent receptor plug domain-containing protein [Gemmatimonadaceae bacterium]|jgi:TonB-linked SusC/RagA family outer membrane protein|nr:TonB-dependent receptor plug domain-containing protein [Gemmatimonadaceae bacterium]
MLVALRPRAALLALATIGIGHAPVAAAQALQLADNGPRFVSVPAHREPSVDMSAAPVLRRPVTLEVDQVPLEAALVDVAAQAHVHLVYSRDAIPLDRPVSVHATRINLAAALTELLIGLGVDVQLSADETHATLVRRVSPVANAQAFGRVIGRVTNAVTHQPLDQVTIRLEGSTYYALTQSDGRYSIRNVEAGAYRVTARRLGYLVGISGAVVGRDSVVTVDLALKEAPNRLGDVVTTAVGDQRRVNVGEVIATINADSIAPTAPITSLTDLISSRAPGVEVQETSGLTGAGESIRIRGLTSLVLQNDPILIVDGVRQDNSAGGDVATYFARQFNGSVGGNHPTPTRLNDLDFADIEKIDILKGPAASTEYGTDAANGVIVITTKHGVAGRPQWKVTAEQTESQNPLTFPDNYYSWGHFNNPAHTPFDCLQIGPPHYPTASSGICTVDSVTKWNPLNHSQYSLFDTGNRAKYGLQVSGGSDAVRYFVSGGITNETGMIKAPSVFHHLLDSAGVSLPGVAYSANILQQRTIRSNTTMRLGSTADLTATGAYLSTYQRTPDAGNLLTGVAGGTAVPSARYFYGYAGSAQNPISELTQIGTQNTDRFTGGLTLNWHPMPWLVAHGTLGLDHGSQTSTTLVYPGLGEFQGIWSPSMFGQVNLVTDLYTADFRASATAPISSVVRAVTSVGAQLVDNRSSGQSASVSGITTANETLSGAPNPVVQPLGSRAATLGGYVEEGVSVADRLFLTGAIRIDAGSGFGNQYKTVAYPKADVSWLAVSNGLTTVRLRGAYGESGVQPQNGASLTLYNTTPIWYVGQPAVGNSITWPGNPTLQPERTAELEGGTDIGLWGNRVSLELTAYSKMTHNALYNQQLGWDLGGYTYQLNLGQVHNAGLEGTLSAALVETRAVNWNVTVNASLNHNKLIKLAPGVSSQLVGLYGGQMRQAQGYPLYGIWAHDVTYADANHDGRLEANEVSIADSASYQGPSQPTQEASVSTHVGLFGGALTFGGLVDYRGGYKIIDAVAFMGNSNGFNQRGGNDPNATLFEQAQAYTPFMHNGNVASNYIVDGSFVRFRELSMTYTVPQPWVRRAHLQSLSLTGAVRNLALWTRYRNGDPEVSNTNGFNVQQNPGIGGFMVNNDVRENAGAVPLPRYFVLRLNVGF